MNDAVLLEWSRRMDLESWSWDKTLLALPSLVNNGLSDELHIPLAGAFSFESPAFKAPTRYFDSLVLNYRSPQSEVRLRVAWTYEGMTDFSEARSLVALLKRSESSRIAQIRLADSPSWDVARTIQKIRLTLEAPDVPNAPAGDRSATDQFVLSYLVFDRNAFSDTFER